MRLGNQRGFTLIELLIVIGIIAILVVVAIPAISRFMTSATVGAANAELQMVCLAVDSCLADAGDMELDGVVVAWEGNSGEVTADDGNFDASEYLTLRQGTLVGSYDISETGEVDGNEYPSDNPALVWDGNKWAESS